MNVKIVKKHYRVTDEMIDSGRVQNVIEPLWWSVSIYDGESEMNSGLNIGKQELSGKSKVVVV